MSEHNDARETRDETCFAWRARAAAIQKKMASSLSLSFSAPANKPINKIGYSTLHKITPHFMHFTETKKSFVYEDKSIVWLVKERKFDGFSPFRFFYAGRLLFVFCLFLKEEYLLKFSVKGDTQN